MRKHEYIVYTNCGVCKVGSEQPFDLISAQKALYDMGETAEIFLIKELNFFEKIVDKLRNL